MMRRYRTTFSRGLWTAVLGICVVALIIMGFSASVPMTQAALDVPQLISYQGRLTDDDRITVTDGSYNMAFAIYDAASGGNCLWSADDNDATSSTIDCTGNTPDGQIAVTVTDGIFSVLLGDTTAGAQNALPDALFDDNAALYLGVTIASDSEMSPRRRIGSAPYALQAGDSDLLDSLDTDNDGCTSACVPVTTANGNLIITGDPQGTDAADGSLYINPDTATSGETLLGIADAGTEVFRVDKEGDTDIAGHAAIGSAADLDANEVLRVFEDFSTGGATRRLIDAVSFLDGALNGAGGIFQGNRVDLTVDSGAGNDVESLTAYRSELNHDGSGTSDALYGVDSDTAVSAGTVTDAFGVDARVTTDNAAGTITTGYGIYGSVGESSLGTITNAYGGYFNAENATSNYAIYTAGGLVHIQGGASPATPNTATGNGELYVHNDIETDANLDVGGNIALVGATPTDESNIEWVDTWSAATEHRGIDAEITATSAQSHTGSYIDIGVNGALNAGGRIFGYNSTVNVDSGAGNDAQAINQYYGSTTHTGTGTTTDFYGLQTLFDIDAAATVTNAQSIRASITTTNASAIISNAYGARITVNPGSGTISNDAIGYYAQVTNATGTITGDAYGAYLDVNGATGAEYALYTARGYVHVEGDSTATTPDFGDVGQNGTAFFQADVQIYDGALCVGDASTVGDDCGSAGGNDDGHIYSSAASVDFYDLAEMYQSEQFLTAGEIVSVDSARDVFVERTETGSVIIGAVSTNPGFVLGWVREGQYPIALTGRTPVKVTTENGPIEVGDRITISSTPGIGMKATAAGEIVGIAMEAYSGAGQGAVMTFIQPHYWDGTALASVTGDAPEATVQQDRVLTIDTGSIRNIQTLEGYNWSVDQFGLFTTEGAYLVSIDGNDGDVTTAAVLGVDHYITLAGTTRMRDAAAVVRFEDVAPEFNDVIDPVAPIIVTATISNGSGTVYITEKSNNGFRINRNSGEGTEVDWIVMAYRKGYVPEELLNPPDESEEEPDEGDEVVAEEEVERESTDEELPAEEPDEESVEELEGSDSTDEEPADPSDDGNDSQEEPVEEEPVEESPTEQSDEEPVLEEGPAEEPPAEEEVSDEPVAEEPPDEEPPAEESAEEVPAE